MPKPQGMARIFLVGGSQAWGAGAADSHSTFAELLERRLRNRGLPVEISNAGVNGAGISKIRIYYDQQLRQFHPDIILADIGLNDSAVLAQKKKSSARRRHVRRLLSTFNQLLDPCARDKADFILRLEPMSMELALCPDPYYYEGLKSAVQKRGCTVIELLEVTAKMERHSMLWWDTAHLAPTGHHLVARLLEGPTAQVVARCHRRFRGPDSLPLTLVFNSGRPLPTP